MRDKKGVDITGSYSNLCVLNQLQATIIKMMGA